MKRNEATDKLDFYIELDPVVFDYWIMDRVTKKAVRKASPEEVALWLTIKARQEIDSYYHTNR